MKRNPVIPYAIIAVLGILTVIVLSIVGVNQQEQIASGDEGSEEVLREPDEIVQSCVGCHGGDLEGVDGAGPSLQTIGSEYTKDEIHDIIINGIDGKMPGGMATGEEAEILAEWLAEKK